MSTITAYGQKCSERHRSLSLIDPKHVSLALLAVIGLSTVSASLAQNLSAPTAQQTEWKLQQRFSVTWQGQGLGAVLQRLAETQGISIWLDRRTDPQQAVDLRLDDVSLTEVLEALVKKQALGFTMLGSVVYVGPVKSSRELQALSRQLHESLKRIPSSTKKRWLRNDPSDWPRLGNPQTLLAELLEEASLKLLSKDLIPHDLWEAKQLSPLPLVDRVVLILVGFDLTARISADGEACEVVPIKHPVAVKRNKRKAKRPKPLRRPARKKEKQYSLQLQNQPVGAIIDQLAKQLKLEVVWDKVASKSRDRRVSCHVKNVGLDELLNSVLSPGGLRFQRDGQQVKIMAE